MGRYDVIVVDRDHGVADDEEWLWVEAAAVARRIDGCLANWTPHPVTVAVPVPGVEDSHEVWVTLDSVGVARAEASERDVAAVAGVPVVSLGFGAPVGLPDPAPHRWLIVSLATAQAATDRTDLLVPARLVRDDRGRVVACRALASIRDLPEWELAAMAAA